MTAAGLYVKWSDVCYDVADGKGPDGKKRTKRILHNVFGSTRGC